MSFNFEEARAIIEAAKKRGAIQAAGSQPTPDAQPEEKPSAILPDWLQSEINAPSPGDKVITPQWRSA